MPAPAPPKPGPPSRAVPAWDIDAVAATCLAVQGIPAPTFAEQARADWVAERLRALGPFEVTLDRAPNVYARLPGAGPAAGAGPGLMVSAHLDTVFPAETDLGSRREGPILHGPGIGDNCMGLAGLLALAEALAAAPRPPCDVWLVANAAEEGLGDLAGMRAALDRLDGRIGACLVLEGSKHHSWPLTHRALGSRRYRIEASADGGHSWGNFGRSSAIHLLAGLAAEIAGWQVPARPRCSFNIGVIQGGTSVNTIAETAWLLLDLRSEDPSALEALAERAEALVARHAAAAARAGDARLGCRRVGDRPAGELPADHPLVEAARQALLAEGVPPERIASRISSTDANIPLARGIPAVCIHLTRGGHAHRLDEWLSLDELPTGLGQLWRLSWAAADWLAAGAPAEVPAPGRPDS
ncbi:MAG: M20/M25/M40 family metallo-hydrolase [Chloroflexi bacterium]|nr:M20/M25/M40 family metallo-hydrolase [Chloroflexota bacterium]